MAIPWDSTWRYSAFILLVVVTGSLVMCLWRRAKLCMGYTAGGAHGVQPLPALQANPLRQVASGQPYVVVQHPLGPEYLSSLVRGRDGILVLGPQWAGNAPLRPGPLPNYALPPHLLDRMPSFVFPSVDKGDGEDGKGCFERECVVCQEDFGQERVMTLPCGHIFHKDCVRPWLLEHATCPTCRLPITADLLLGRVSFTTDGSPDINAASTSAPAGEPMTVSRNIAWHSNSVAGAPVIVWPNRGPLQPLGIASTSASGLNPAGNNGPAPHPPAQPGQFRPFWPRQTPSTDLTAPTGLGPPLGARALRRSRSRSRRGRPRHAPPAFGVAGEDQGPQLPRAVARTEPQPTASSTNDAPSNRGVRAGVGVAEAASGSGAVELSQVQTGRSGGPGEPSNAAHARREVVSGTGAGASSDVRTVDPLTLRRVLPSEARQAEGDRAVAGEAARVPPAANPGLVGGSGS